MAFSREQTFAVFSGQGSQVVGMGKDLCDNFSSARHLFEEASDAIKVNLKKLCFEGPESDLQLTENTQPALLVTSVAAFKVCEEIMQFRPAAVAGHSLGEYSALVCAGAFPLSQAVKWVRERGKAMQIAVPAGEGSMAAVMGLDDASVEKLCTKAKAEALARRRTQDPGISVACTVEPANFNSPGQVVIAGSKDAVAVAVEMAKSDSEFSGTKCIPLAVSAPFHCSLMKPAKDRMQEIFRSASPAGALKFPYLPNRTARITTEPTAIYSLLTEQVDQTVMWRQSIETLINNGMATAIEFGPGKVLCGLVKRIDLNKKTTQQNVSDLATVKVLEAGWKPA